MYRWMITCIGTSNISLTNEVRWALEEEAVAMIRSGTDSVSFRAGMAEGRIRKERDHVSFVNDGGPLFSAEVETELGTGKVRFIIPERYLRALDGGWKSVKPGRSENLDRRAAKAMLNEIFPDGKEPVF